MSLFACPNELLEQIIYQVTGDDLENLASTCRLIREVARPMLKEHYTLKNKYGYTQFNYPGREPTHPAQLLDIIIDDPRAITYISKLSLTYRLPQGRRFAAHVAKIKARTDRILEKHDFFWSLLISNPSIPEAEASSWYKQIREGRIDALYALLLYYLHNLKEVRIDRPIFLPQTFVMISRLQRSIYQRRLDDRSCNTHDGGPIRRLHLSKERLGLEKLQGIIIDPAEASDVIHRRQRLANFARFAVFSSFPEVRHLHGISLSSRKYNLDEDFSGFPKLESVRLVNCNIAPQSFRSLLSGVQNLRSFHYAPTIDVKELSKVLEDLKKHAGHSLTKLYLRHNVIEARSEAWKYQAFKQLKIIDLDWRCLVYFYDESVTSTVTTSSPNKAPKIHSEPSCINTARISFDASAETTPEPSVYGTPSSPKKAIRQDQKIQHPQLADVMPSTIESIKIVDIDGEAKLEDVRWLFFKLRMNLRRFPKLKVIIFVTPRQDCWMHAKNICSQAGLKYPTYSCDKEKRISGIHFVYE